MRIRESRNFDRCTSGGFDAEYTAASIAELEEQYAAGEIEPHAYLIKKRALVRLFLKSTTRPRRHYRDEGSAL